MNILFPTLVGALFVGTVIVFATWVFVAFSTLIEFLAPYDDERPSNKRIAVVIIPLIAFFLFGSYILGTYYLTAAGHR